MTTEAAIGYGTKFKVRTSTSPVTFTEIGEQTNVTPYGLSVDSIDVSHENSPNRTREFIPGLIDSGEASFDMNYVPGGEAEALLFSMKGSVQVCRVVFPSGARADYSAFITEVSPETPIDDKMAASVTFKLTGEIVMTPAAAPSNLVKPAIAGIAQQGVELTALEGVWDGEPTSFTYQWKNEGTNIGGATAKTYTPVSGDVGDNITVAVTGVNSAGSATAVSAETTSVLAP